VPLMYAINRSDSTYLSYFSSERHHPISALATTFYVTMLGPGPFLAVVHSSNGAMNVLYMWHCSTHGGSELPIIPCQW